MSPTNEVVRWITGRRSDDDDPGGRVIAVVFAPRQQPTGEYGTRVWCPYVHCGYMPVFGADETQCIELAIRLVVELLVHHGVRDITVSLVPPDDMVC